jgi:hypothetical protein
MDGVFIGFNARIITIQYTVWYTASLHFAAST